MKNIVFPASHGLSDFPWLRTHDETFLNKAVSTSSSEQALWATTRTSHLRRLPKQIYSKPPGGPSLSLVYKSSSYLCPNSTVVSYTFTIPQASFLLHIQHAVLPVEQPETRLKSLTEERSPPVRPVLQQERCHTVLKLRDKAPPATRNRSLELDWDKAENGCATFVATDSLLHSSSLSVTIKLCFWS